MKKKPFQDDSFLDDPFQDSPFRDDPFLNDRGITLPTIIIVAVLALLASATGVIIYNAVRDRSMRLDDTAAVIEEIRKDFEEEREIERMEEERKMEERRMEEERKMEEEMKAERQKQIVIEIQENRTLENDERLSLVQEDGISDRLYMDVLHCPDFEIRHWHSLIDNGRDATPTRLLLPPRKLTSVSPTTNVSKQNPQLTAINQNWIEADGNTIIVSSEQMTTACSYRSTPDSAPKITDISNVPQTIVGNLGTIRQYSDISYNYNAFDLSTLNNATYIRSNIEPALWHGDCLRSGMYVNKTSIPPRNRSCLLYRSPSLARLPTDRSETAKIGLTKRSSAHLTSYCAAMGGYIPFEKVAYSAIGTYGAATFSKCIVNPSRHGRTCALYDLGLLDVETSNPLLGFSIAFGSTNSKCTIIEQPHSASDAKKAAVTSTSRAEYALLHVNPNCPDWKLETENIEGTDQAPTPSRLPICSYDITGANAQVCANFGLAFDTRFGNFCFYVYTRLGVIHDVRFFYGSTSAMLCEGFNEFKIDKTTGRGTCERRLGDISRAWHLRCTGWAYTASVNYDHDNDPNSPMVADDDSSVYAYYSAETKTYHCSFKNRYLNSARECLSFGYSPGELGECEVVDWRTYNPAPYAPTCAVFRAVPYYTSQEQLFSISSLNLAFRNNSSRNVANSSLGVSTNNDASSNDFLYDNDNNVLPNINNQLSYYYNRLIKPAVESYLTSGDRHTELWLPSQFPTGNVSLSRTFSQQGYPAATSPPDFTESRPLDFVYNRRSPNPISNCDDYKQFYHPIHIEKSSATTETYTAGYNDNDKSVVCGTDSKNFWEPRYYLDVITSGTSYTGNYCDSSTTACPTPPTGSKLYRECSLVGTDTAFTRPAEKPNSTFDYQNNNIDAPINSYVKECEDLGYSGGTYELYDYELLPKISGQNYVALSQLSSNEPVDWVAPANSFRNYTPSEHANTSLGYRDFWVRSDARQTRISTSGPQFYLLGGQGINPENKATANRFEAEGGLVWSRYGIAEMLNYINTQNITSSGENTREAVLRFSNSTDFGARTQSALTSFTNAPLDPATPTGTQAGYVAGGGFSASRGGADSTLTYYAPYAELNCEFRVPVTASANVQAFFRACQSLGSYFFTRFSYHKPIEVKPFNVSDITFPSGGRLPTGENFGHWRANLLTESGGAKHPSLIKYGDATYKPPTYFHINTDRNNGYYYCEANPSEILGYGDINPALQRSLPLPKRTTGTTAENTDCDRLNAILGITTSASSTTFETISEMSGTEAQIKAASDIGFIGHKEGPYDFYPCKWRAPFKGNPLAG